MLNLFAYPKVARVKGHSTTTWTNFCHFLTPPPCIDSFYTLSVNRNRQFLTPSPPHLVYVVRGRPQRTSAIFRGGGGTQLQTFADMKGEVLEGLRCLKM